ncbi:MAG: PAC2 family protein [Nitrososphaerota archaeon]|nr:PAC2 family protein [Aigarchaeota archaeon]MDW8077164.1 PAC2 family protein [Nitrososphaerota archaeon]
MVLEKGMLETDVIFEKGLENFYSEDAVLIEGLPGVGLVAKVAVSYLLTKLDLKRVCRLYSPYFSNIGFIRDGRLMFSFSDIYLAKSPRPMLLLYGNAQPITSYGQYEFCEKILDVAQKFGCKFVITLGGYGRDLVSDKRMVFCSSTDKNMLEKWVRKIGGLRYSGQIIGAAGLLVTLASMRNMNGLSILIETNGSAPDFFGAMRAIESLNKLLDINIKPKDLEELSSAYAFAEIEYERL